MKRIFMGILYILLIVMIFVYVLTNCVRAGVIDSSTSNQPIISASAFTGLSIIGFIFTFPAFVFTILSLTMDMPIHKFLRDMFSFFASIFILASAVITVIKYNNDIYNYFVPVILMVCCTVILVFSLIGVIVAINHDTISKKEKKEVESNENKDVESINVEKVDSNESVVEVTE